MPTTDNKLISGIISVNGLINIFGTTLPGGEQETGLMTVPSITDWITRINKTEFATSGPTGAWAGDWWSVYNYLYYDNGICVVGATGSTGDYYSATGQINPSSTPLHNKNLVNLDVVFSGETQLSAQIAGNIATSRRDCVAFVGNSKPLPVNIATTGFTAHFDYFGVTANNEYVSFYAGRKTFLFGDKLPRALVNKNNVIEINTSSDIAGCMSNVIIDRNLWTSVAGVSRGTVKNINTLKQSFSDLDQSRYYASRINPLRYIPSSKVYSIMGNRTGLADTTTNLSNTNIVSMVVYLKKQISNVLRDYLFEINTNTTRLAITAELKTILENLIITNGITDYVLVCDETNNTPTIISSGKLVVDLTVTPESMIDTMQINFVLDGNVIDINDAAASVIVTITPPRVTSFSAAKTYNTAFGSIAPFNANVGTTSIDFTWMGVTHAKGISGYNVTVTDGITQTTYNIQGTGTTHFYYPRVPTSGSTVGFSVAAYNIDGAGNGSTTESGVAYISIISDGVLQTTNVLGLSGFYFGSAGYFVNSNGELDFSGSKNIPKLTYGTTNGISWQKKGIVIENQTGLSNKNRIMGDTPDFYNSLGLTLAFNSAENSNYQFWAAGITGITLYRLNETAFPYQISLNSITMGTDYVQANGAGYGFWNISAFFKGGTAPASSPGLTMDIASIWIRNTLGVTRTVYFDVTNCVAVGGNYPNPSRGVSFGEGGTHFTQRYQDGWCLCSHATSVTGPYATNGNFAGFGIATRDGLGGFTNAAYPSGSSLGFMWIAAPGVQTKNALAVNSPVSSGDQFNEIVKWGSYKKPLRYKNNETEPNKVNDCRIGMHLFSKFGLTGGYQNGYTFNNGYTFANDENNNFSLMVDLGIDVGKTTFTGKLLPASYSSGGHSLGKFILPLETGYQDFSAGSYATDQRNYYSAGYQRSYGYTFGVNSVVSYNYTLKWDTTTNLGFTFTYGNVSSFGVSNKDYSNIVRRELHCLNNKQQYVYYDGLLGSLDAGITAFHVFSSLDYSNMANWSEGAVGQNSNPAEKIWWIMSDQNEVSDTYYIRESRFYNQFLPIAQQQQLATGITLEPYLF